MGRKLLGDTPGLSVSYRIIDRRDGPLSSS
jgi:hypothetical protein